MATVYATYGLRLRSDLPLPALPEAAVDEPPTASLRMGDVRKHAAAPPRGTGCFVLGSRRLVLFHERAGALLIRDGREIVVEPGEACEEDFLQALVMGQGLALLLHQRGLLTLHASAVTIRRQVVAFLGNKGYGKSTTAGALYRQGRPLFTDDVLAVDVDPVDRDAAPVAFAGPARFKLWPDAAARLTGEALPRLYASSEKRTWQIDGAQIDGAPSGAVHPLGLLYVLGRGAALCARRMDAREAFSEILCHAYTGQATLPTGTARRHLAQCAALVRHVPVYRLERPPALEALPALARFVEEHVRAVLSGAEATGAQTSGAETPA